MGFRLLERATDLYPFITPLDEAIGDHDAWARYSESGDESILKLSGEPTRFLIRPAEQRLIEQAEHWVGKGGTPELSRATARELVRVCVGGCENPPEDWPKPVMARERGETLLAREVVDRLPQEATLTIALFALRLGHGVANWRRVGAGK